MTEVKVPYLGEGISKARVTFIYFKPGDSVSKEADLVEVTTDKAAFNIPAPCGGKIAELKVSCGDMVNIGDIVCVIASQ